MVVFIIVYILWALIGSLLTIVLEDITGVIYTPEHLSDIRIKHVSYGVFMLPLAPFAILVWTVAWVEDIVKESNFNKFMDIKIFKRR